MKYIKYEKGHWILKKVKFIQLGNDLNSDNQTNIKNKMMMFQDTCSGYSAERTQ